MTKEIGEIIHFEGVKLKVVEHDYCRKCYFLKNKINCQTQEYRNIIGDCTSDTRSDGKYAVFLVNKQIK